MAVAKSPVFIYLFIEILTCLRGLGIKAKEIASRLRDEKYFFTFLRGVSFCVVLFAQFSNPS